MMGYYYIKLFCLFICNYWIIYEVGNKVILFGDCFRNNGGGGGGEDVLEKLDGVWGIV